MRRIGMVAVVVLLACGAANAADILKIDYQDLHDTYNGYPPSAPPAGFEPGGGPNPWGNNPAAQQVGVSWDWLGGTVTYGAYTVVTSTPGYARGRMNDIPYYASYGVPNVFPGYAGTTLGEMFRDGIGPEGWGGNAMDFTISGLALSTTYDLTVWAWAKEALTTTVTDTTSGSTLLGTIVSAVADPTSDTSYSLTGSVMSDGTGQIKFQTTGTNNNYVINGFRIAEPAGPVIPEPATILLVGTGALGVFGYIRRRRMA